MTLLEESNKWSLRWVRGRKESDLECLLSNMDSLSHLLLIPGLLALILLFNLWISSRRPHKEHQTNGNGKSPPEVTGAWPVIGHLHLLSDRTPLARTLAAMADKYGPIFTLRLGVHRMLVVNSWEAIKDCFTTNDKIFANRPHSSQAEYLGYNSASIGFGSYGPLWRRMRRLIVVELLSARRLEMLKRVRVSEVETSVKELYKDCPGKVVMSEWLERLTLNIIVRTMTGKRYHGDIAGETDSEAASHMRRVIKEFMYLTGDFVLSDLIPFPPLRWVDLFGKLKEFKRIAKELDCVLEKWIEEHRRRIAGDEEEDFIDVMLSKIDERFADGHTRDTIVKATLMDLILAGSETTFVHLTWLLSLLLNNRHALKLAQQEMDDKVGKDRWVEESDIVNLPYLRAIVKEMLRLYPPAPIAVPHEASEDCRVGGYHIPKGTSLFVNVWKLHQDPRIWSDPDEFKPERFLSSQAKVDASGHHFEFVPFGSGRRSCPGIKFATQVTHLTVARLLQGFEMATKSNEAVDMAEGFGFTLPKATPLEVLITPRLSYELYM